MGFDVHAMIYAEDASRLERELHRKLLLNQINKTNSRKEFFRVTITELREMVEMLGLTCTWTLAADAAEYRESLAIDECIKSDPKAREQWQIHQMLVDPVTDEMEDEDSELEAQASQA